MLNVAVIGAGMMGRHHVRVFDELKNARLVAVADVDKKKLEELRKKYKISVYTDYMEMLKKEDVDAVSIAVPTTLHARVAVDCIKAGKHVLVEKPLSHSLQEAKKIVDAAKKHEVKLMVGYVERFNPIVQKLKKLLSSNVFGEVHFVATTRIGPFPKRIRDVGVITDLATHDFDVIRFLLEKEPKKIFASTISGIKTKFEDVADVMLFFSSKLKANVEANWIAHEKIRELLLIGSDAMARLDYINQEMRVIEARSFKQEKFSNYLLEVYSNEEKRIKLSGEEPLRIELDHFVKCVENDKEPLVGGEDGIKLVKLSLKALESARLKKVLDVGV